MAWSLRARTPRVLRSGRLAHSSWSALFPLLPFLLPALGVDIAFAVSSLLTALTFFGIGFMKGVVLGEGRWRAGLETLLMGGGAAIIAYLVGGVFEPMITEMGLAVSR